MGVVGFMSRTSRVTLDGPWLERHPAMVPGPHMWPSVPRMHAMFLASEIRAVHGAQSLVPVSPPPRAHALGVA
jgi:hypothetical protein